MPNGPMKPRKREAALAALLSEKTIAAAAERAGIGERTLRLWLKEDADFREAYRHARLALVDEVTRRLQRAGASAVGALLRNLRSGAPPTEVRAALGILDTMFRATELNELARRVDELEQRLKGGQTS